MRALPERLRVVADEAHRLKPTLAVDVGCDHGGLALTLVSEGVATIAVDVNRAPCDLARENARKSGVSLEVRQGDGLDAVPEAVDLVMLCGVGAETIIGVLARAGQRAFSVIAQPNTQESKLRAWAQSEGWCVVRERAMWAGDRFFVTLVMTRGPWPADEVELAWGVSAQVDTTALGRRLRAEVQRLAPLGKADTAISALRRLDSR